MTETEQRMRKLLMKTGLYDGGDRLFSAEMAAYGAGLGMLFDAVAQSRRNLFVRTADAETLDRFEKLFRILPSGSDTETRREMLLQRGSVTPADHTKAALEKQLLAAGIRGNIVEKYEGGIYVNVQEVLGISEAAAAFEARTFLPAHLPCVIDFGVNTWDTVDARDMSFDEMDAADSTWNSIDRI